MGVATANSILVVSFARQRMGEGLDPLNAALDAGATRITAGVDDSPGDDHRYDPHGTGPGRRGRAKCAPGPRGHRRSAVCHGFHLVLRSGDFCGRSPAPRSGAKNTGRRRLPPLREVPDMSETDSSAVLRRAKIMVGAIVGVLLAGGVVVLVLRSFQASALETSTALHAKQYVTTMLPTAGSDGAPIDAARHSAGGHRIDGLCAQQRLYRAMGQGHRRFGEKRRTAGRDHRPRDRPGIIPGRLGACAGRRKRRAGQEHRRSLAGLAQEGRGDAAGLG